MLSKRAIMRIAAITAIFIAISLTFIFKSTDFADTAFRKNLHAYGIDPTMLPAPEKRIGALRYKDIVLSDEGETSIDALTVTFSPLQWENAQSIDIDGLFLSGELDINGKLSIKGLPTILRLPPITNSLKKLSFSNINFSILSAHLGGIRGTANISAHNNEQTLIWAGNIDSQQDQLELIAKFNGQLNQSGRWVNDFEIENAKLERNYGKFTRAYGTATWSGENTTWQRFEADLNPGGLIANGTAWKNGAITIQSTPTLTKATIAAKSAGIEELELSIDALYKNKSLKWNASVHAPTATQLINYFSANNMMPVNPDLFASIKDEKDVTLRLGTKNSNLVFNIKNTAQRIDIKGKIKKSIRNLFQIILVSKKNFQDGIKGAKCKKTGTEKRQTCTMTLAYRDKEYILKD